MTGPLVGIRVLDWTQWQMGTVATAMLADLGASVIHIEHRITGDPGRGLWSRQKPSLPYGKSWYFETNNRGKKSITVDLAQEKGKEIIYRLVKNSDVFVQNFRQGVPEKLKLDYDTLYQYNPRLIYAATSGYGPDGPEAMEPSFDYIGLARSGIMTMVGEPGMPPLPPPRTSIHVVVLAEPAQAGDLPCANKARAHVATGGPLQDMDAILLLSSCRARHGDERAVPVKANRPPAKVVAAVGSHVDAEQRGRAPGDVCLFAVPSILYHHPWRGPGGRASDQGLVVDRLQRFHCVQAAAAASRCEQKDRDPQLQTQSTLHLLRLPPRTASLLSLVTSPQPFSTTPPPCSTPIQG